MTTNSTNNHYLSYQQLWELVVDNAQQNLVVPLEDESGFVDPMILTVALFANLYLENNKHGDPDKQGRFYWMAFSVFTQMNLLRYVMNNQNDDDNNEIKPDDVQALFSTDLLTHQEIIDKFDDQEIVKQIKQALSDDIRKYSLWLTLDMLSTHFLFQIDETVLSREETKNKVYEHPEDAAIHYHLSDMRWFEEAQPHLINANNQTELYASFNWIKQYNADKINEHETLFNHLLGLAEHINKNITNPLLYGKESILSKVDQLNQQLKAIKQDPDFCLLTDTNIGLEINSYFPHMEETIATPQKQVVKPLSYASRMQKIKEEIEKFHYLMQSNHQQMKQQIQNIAAWITFDNK